MLVLFHHLFCRLFFAKQPGGRKLVSIYNRNVFLDNNLPSLLVIVYSTLYICLIYIRFHNSVGKISHFMTKMEIGADQDHLRNIDLCHARSLFGIKI